MGRLRVRFICDSHYKDWNSGDVGYVDGYCRGGDGVPCVVVMAPLETIRVMNEAT